MLRAPIDKLFVAITREFTPVADSNTFASSVIDNPVLIFAPSDVRGATLVADQGDHATAYALYWESIRAEVASTIQGSQNHVSSFTTKIYSKPNLDQQALKACGLYPNISVVASNIDALAQKVNGVILNRINIQANQDLKTCTQNLQMLKEILANYKKRKPDHTKLIELQKLEQEANQLKIQIQLIQHFDNWDEKFTTLAQNVENMRNFHQEKIDVLNKERDQIEKIMKKNILRPKDRQVLVEQNARKLSQIQEVKKEYFYQILQQLSEQYLLYQNQMPYVTFERVPTQTPASGEGTRIANGLQSLREIHDLRRGSMTTDISDEDYDTINKKLQDLLFFPKVTPDNLKALEEQREKLLSNNRIQNWLQYLLIRDNKPEVLAYVVARHLQSFFDAFPGFSVNDVCQKITKSFVDKMLAEWSLDSQVETSCRAQVTALLGIYQSRFSAIDASLHSQDSRSLTSLTMSDGELQLDEPQTPPPKRQRTLLTMFEEKTQKDKAKRAVQVSNSSIQPPANSTIQQQTPPQSPPGQ